MIPDVPVEPVALGAGLPSLGAGASVRDSIVVLIARGPSTGRTRSRNGRRASGVEMIRKEEDGTRWWSIQGGTGGDGRCG